MSRLKPLFLVLVGVTLAIACRERRGEEASDSFLEAEWRGKDTAEIRGPATAEWCDSLRLLEIQALRGDTGVAIAVYPPREVEAGRVRVVLPTPTDSTRPRAAVALRWFAETSIRGFQGDSGAVVLEQPRPGVLTGTFTAWARSVTDTATVSIRGNFRNLLVRPSSRGCPARRAHPDTNAGVH